ncbi:MAG: hypothetical protein A2Z02_06665 [Chloroflexi bacterium RBG_16_48_7]|nr:MAG: hypothetical protein A2Z02_06665 [Chloroflexi bacterium RBG_16_48_7]
MRCASCGTENIAEAKQCSKCGATLENKNALLEFLRSVNNDSSGVLASVTVFFFCVILSLVLWYPLSIPTRIIRALIPVNVNCTKSAPGSFDMYMCSAGVGLFTIAVPLLSMLVIFIFRKQLMRLAKKLTPKLPEVSRFLIMPSFATIVFVISWSGGHKDTGLSWGIMPQIAFPAVIGLFTYVISRYGKKIQLSLKSFFDTRDKIPRILRFVLAAAIPLLISLAITAQQRVSFETLKEQFVVLVALIIGFLVMAPRSGDIIAGARKAVSGQPKKT